MSYEEIQLRTPVARKQHQCEWCPEPILKGDRHVYRFYRWSGETMSGRMHQECYDAMGRSSDQVSDGWIPQENERGVEI